MFARKVDAASAVKGSIRIDRDVEFIMAARSLPTDRHAGFGGIAVDVAQAFGPGGYAVVKARTDHCVLSSRTVGDNCV